SLAGFFNSTGNAFHLKDATQKLETYDPIAWEGKYDGQFQFLLHLPQPMEVIEKSAILSWLQSHRNGHVVSIENAGSAASEPLKIDYMQFYREHQLWIRSLHQ
ncbi:MAG: hypothetical protein ACU88J_12515, partial [Gammaproteobacteria bacterium]